MPITHHTPTAKPNNAAKDVSATAWNEAHDGSALPPQWTDGGNGNVTATTDDGTKTTLTLKASTAQTTASPATPPLKITGPDDATVFYINVETADNGATFDMKIPDPGLSTFGVDHHMTLDGSPSINCDAAYYSYCMDGFIGFELFFSRSDATQSYSTLFIREQVSQTQEALRVAPSGGGRVFVILAGGAPVIGQTTAPADALLNNSEMALWLDDTPGATKLKIKAKDSGGTVRTGSVNLT